MSRCAECGLEFSCGMMEGDGQAPCWCMQLPALPRALLATQPAGKAACFCPACLGRRIEEAQNADSATAPGDRSRYSQARKV